MMVTNRDKPLEERTGLVDSKFVSMVQGHFPVTHLSECIQFVLQDISLQKGECRKQQANRKQIFKTYTGKDLIQEATEGNTILFILNHRQFCSIFTENFFCFGCTFVTIFNRILLQIQKEN